MEGRLERTITLPGIGTASGFGTKHEEKETYYTFTNYVYPPTIFKLDIASGASSVYKKSNVQFDPTQYVSEQVFYKSKDGTFSGAGREVTFPDGSKKFAGPIGQ